MKGQIVTLQLHVKQLFQLASIKPLQIVGLASWKKNTENLPCMKKTIHWTNYSLLAY